MVWKSEAPSSIAQPSRSTSVAVGLWISIHSPTLSPTAAGLRMISEISSSAGAAGCSHELAAPGLPRSPAPKRSTDSHQLAPSALSPDAKPRAIELPFGIGKPFAALQSTRSTTAPVADLSTTRPLALYSGTPVPYT